MPQAIVPVLASLGSTVTFGAVATTSIFAPIIGGAVVGAAVGGLTSFVTGGDIGKGLLFGAIGGAVTGGMMGAFTPEAFALTGTVPVGTSTAGGAAAAAGGENLVWATAGGATHAGTMLGADTLALAPSALKVGAGLSGTDLMKASMYGSLAEGAVGMAGNIFAGMGEEEMTKAKLAFEKEQADAARAHDKEMAQLEASLSEGRYPDYAAELAEKRRQFDLDLAERRRQFNTQLQEARDKRKRGSSAVQAQGFKRANFVEKPTSIYNQVQEDTNSVQDQPWVNPLQEAANA